jgi:pimeloyl-ACP methyl ester carboxylesterase
VTAWYDVHGAGRPLVLLHAGGVDSRLWEAQLGPFGRSHTVVRLDFPAHRLA